MKRLCNNFIKDEREIYIPIVELQIIWVVNVLCDNYIEFTVKDKNIYSTYEGIL